MAEKDVELFTRTIGNKSITLQKEMSAIDAAVNYQLKAEKQVQQDRAKLIAEYQKEIDQRSKTARTKKEIDELNHYKKLLAAEEQAEKKHQQYREKLIPGLKEIKEALKHEENVMGVVISGAGPSVLVISYGNNLAHIRETVSNVWADLNVKSKILTLQVEESGARIVDN